MVEKGIKFLPFGCSTTVARKYLSVCATSVPAEQVFSCGGNVVFDKRSCLKPDKVDNLVVIALNMKD